MQKTFTRWCIDPQGRTAVSVDPTRVECTEHFSVRFTHAGTGEEFPPATKIVMKGKQEYIVQGDLAAVVQALNPADSQLELLKACSFYLNMLPNEEHHGSPGGFASSYDLAAALSRYLERATPC